MQLTIADAAKNKLLKDAGMSIPDSISAKHIFGKEYEHEAIALQGTMDNVLVELWHKQHPLMHTWLLLSSVSICFLSAIFFIIP